MRRVDGPDRALIAEAAAVLLLVRLGLRLLPFHVLSRMLGRYAHLAATRSSDDTAARVAHAVNAVARRLPGRTTCLAIALAADALLRRRGLASQIRYGVRPPQGTALDAHAWVEHDGVVVVGEVENLGDYAPLSSEPLNP